jgi:hypothetical protein
MWTSYYNIKKLHFVTQCFMYVSGMILKTNSLFPQTALAMETTSVHCEHQPSKR